MSTAAPSRTGASTSLALALLIVINVFNYVDRQVLAAVVKPIGEDFGASQAKMGSLVTAFMVTYMICAPIFGLLADRFGKWKLIGLSMIVQSLASGGSGFADAFFFLLIMRCLVGVGEAAWGPAAPALISDMYPAEKRGKVLAMFYAAIPVGSALGYAVGGGMLALTGKWEWAFYVLCPPGVIIGLICFFFRDPPRDPLQAAPPKVGLAKYLRLFRIPSYTINSAGMTLMTFALGGIAIWMPQYLEKDRGLSVAQSTIYFGVVCAVAGLVATITGGAIGDRLRGKFAGSYFHVCGVGMLLGFPLFLLVLVTPFPYAWVFLFASVFCLFLNTGPGNAIIANIVPPHMRSTAFALNIFLIHALGDAISPPIIGRIADLAKTPTSTGLGTGFFYTSLMIAVGGVVWWTGAYFLARDMRVAAEPVVAEVPPLVDEVSGPRALNQGQKSE